jgi:sugar lactone lactonase YvrE
MIPTTPTAGGRSAARGDEAEMTVVLLPSRRYALAEGPQWDAEAELLSWVDIEAGEISVAILSGSGDLAVQTSHKLDGRVGFALPTGDGGFIAGVDDRLCLLADDGSVSAWSRPLLPAGCRFNDAVADPAGRLLAGGLNLAGARTLNPLLRLEHDGTITVIDDNLQLSNGLGFSPDHSTLYSVDSLAHVVYRRPYDAGSGRVGDRHLFARVDDAEPDGLTVDSVGGVWVALWGGSAVRCFAEDGTVRTQVRLPPTQVTSLAFVGPRLDRAVITTAAFGMTPDELDSQPDAGRLFLVDLRVSGQPSTRWRPVSLPQ